MKNALPWRIETGRRARRLACLALTASLASAACVRTEFVKTSSSFVEHEAKARPTVYVDKLPAEPYESVGIIEVIAPAGLGLSEIMSTAADKGQEVGCDLVVDRGIHRVGSVPIKRWTVSVSEPETAPPEVKRPAARDARYLGVGLYAPPPPPPPPVVYHRYSPPPDKHEFICGVWLGEPSGSSE